MTRTLLLLLPMSILFACKDAPEPTDSDAEEFTAEVLPAGAHPSAAFMSVGGTSPDDVWVAGADPGTGGLALHWDGSQWTSLTNSSLYDLWWVHAFDADTVMFAGAGATILSWDGVTLTRHKTPGLARDTVYGLWGASPDEVWAVGGWAGRWGFLWRYDGSEWQNVSLPDDMPLDANGELPALLKVWGRAKDDVYVVGGNGTILHYDGSSWSVVESGTTARLFTVTGDDAQIAITGGDSSGVLLLGDATKGFTDATPPGAPVLQGLSFEDGGALWVTGADAAIFRREGGEWTYIPNDEEAPPESLHGAWHDGESLWAVGGAVLTGSLNEGVIWRTDKPTELYVAEEIETPAPSCPEGYADPVPDGSIAHRWNEQMINSIRRDIPRPGVHARNLFHVSAAMWDAWAAYDAVADGLLTSEKLTSDDVEGDREIAISYAAYRVLTHRYTAAVGGATSTACYDEFMGVLGLDPTDTHSDGDDPVALGNRVAEAIIDHYADDGANEHDDYKDTTGWTSPNPPIVVDDPGVGALVDPNEWTLLNIALAETQNGIVLDSGLQGYICPTWGLVEPFSIAGPPETMSPPKMTDAEMSDWVMDVIRKTSWLDVASTETIDLSPGAYGNNSLGANDGLGHAVNPITGSAYEPNVTLRSDFGRVLAEYWADGPKSETPPGHWNVIANDVSDALPADALRIGGEGDPVDRLQWDVSLYLAINGAVHDAAITAWGVKRDYTAARPIQLVRYMASLGQSSDPTLPSYNAGGLPLEDGLVELITEESAAPGERHFELRWFVGELAIYTWRGEPGDRANDVGGHAWVRALEWIPYQRRTFVTPGFPGYISGHSTFSRAGAEVLTSFTGSPYYPGGLGEFVANPSAYLVFEDGPIHEVRLQWATYYDAADQAGQSRIWGGIHIWPDDGDGRTQGAEVGLSAWELARSYMDGTAY